MDTSSGILPDEGHNEVVARLMSRIAELEERLYVLPTEVADNNSISIGAHAVDFIHKLGDLWNAPLSW